MTRKLPGGNLEDAVLAAVMDLGSATTRQVHDLVGEPAGLAYTTTATVLDRLHDKQLVERRLEGKTFLYKPRVRAASLAKAMAKEALARLLGPKPSVAMAALVDAVESTDPQLLDELERLVQEKRKSRDGT